MLLDGDISHYTDRTLYVLSSAWRREVLWPNPERRDNIKRCIQTEHGIPGCIGFIDGSHINLRNAPAKPVDAAAGFWSRKKRYGMLLLAAIDHRKRFIFIHHGYSARSSDMRAQQACRLHSDSEAFFSDGEYLLGDSGFLASDNIIPMFKKTRGTTGVTGRKVCKLFSPPVLRNATLLTIEGLL